MEANLVTRMLFKEAQDEANSGFPSEMPPSIATLDEHVRKQ